MTKPDKSSKRFDFNKLDFWKDGILDLKELGRVEWKDGYKMFISRRLGEKLFEWTITRTAKGYEWKQPGGDVIEYTTIHELAEVIHDYFGIDWRVIYPNVLQWQNLLTMAGEDIDYRYHVNSNKELIQLIYKPYKAQMFGSQEEVWLVAHCLGNTTNVCNLRYIMREGNDSFYIGTTIKANDRLNLTWEWLMDDLRTVTNMTKDELARFTHIPPPNMTLAEIMTPTHRPILTTKPHEPSSYKNFTNTSSQCSDETAPSWSKSPKYELPNTFDTETSSSSVVIPGAPSYNDTTSCANANCKNEIPTFGTTPPRHDTNTTPPSLSPGSITTPPTKRLPGAPSSGTTPTSPIISSHTPVIPSPGSHTPQPIIESCFKVLGDYNSSLKYEFIPEQFKSHWYFRFFSKIIRSSRFWQYFSLIYEYEDPRFTSLSQKYSFWFKNYWHLWIHLWRMLIGGTLGMVSSTVYNEVMCYENTIDMLDGSNSFGWNCFRTIILLIGPTCFAISGRYRNHVCMGGFPWLDLELYPPMIVYHIIKNVLKLVFNAISFAKPGPTEKPRTGKATGPFAKYYKVSRKGMADPFRKFFNWLFFWKDSPSAATTGANTPNNSRKSSPQQVTKRVGGANW